MTNTLHRADDGTIELTMTIPWADMQKMYEAVVADMVESAELPGFRKGKAPRSMVEETLDRNKVYEEAIKRLVPQAYTDAVNEHKLKPVLMPQIELKEAQENKDWVVSAKTAEAPQVTLGDFKKAIADIKAEKAKKPAKTEGKEENKDAGKPTLDEVLGAVLSVTKVTLPAILVEHETNHQLSQLIDQTKRLGLTVEQYLASSGKTTETIRADYAQQTIKTLSLEFALEAIAAQEKVEAGADDIAKILATAKSDAERASLEKEQYYLTTLVKRQKTVDMLMAL
jgi:FKBP-type peptidyl-prolyl cis-trans isomerase (trigger factor)